MSSEASDWDPAAPSDGLDVTIDADDPAATSPGGSGSGGSGSGGSGSGVLLPNGSSGGHDASDATPDARTTPGTVTTPGTTDRPADPPADSSPTTSPPPSSTPPPPDDDEPLGLIGGVLAILDDLL